MAGYGRLEVFFPDGMHKTFVLTEDNVSVGRQPGNVIPLDTETISRYHLTIAHHDGDITITDLESANGTFVDGLRLKQGDAHPLIGGEEILIGDLRLFFYSLDESPTRPNLPPVEEAPPHVSADQATFHIEMDEPEIAVPPGAHTSAELRVINRGTLSERFVVEVTGVPRQWVRIDRPEFDLRPDDQAYVQISFKPLRKPDSAPGAYPVTVIVRHKNDPAQAVQGVVTLHILPYGGFGMVLEGRTLAPDQPFRVHLHNQGSGSLPIRLSAADPSGKLRISLLPDQALLLPDQRLVVNGTAAPRSKRLFGSPQRLPFDIVVRSGDAAAFTIAQRAHLTERPSLPGWAIYALLGVILLVVLGIGGALLLLTRPPAPPAVTGLIVQPASVPAGQPLQVSWDAEGASGLTLSVNGAVVETLAGDATSASLATGGLEGVVEIALLASNAGGEASAEATAVVTIPLTIETFNASPPVLMRHIAMPVTFAWSAPGAESVQLMGAEALTANSIPGTLPAEGTITVNAYVITPDPEVLLTLVAQDAAGNLLQQSLALPVIDPLCTPAASATLYNLPFAGTQVISTVPAGTPVVVDARNADSTWLRVRLGGVRGWGEANAFTCNEGFDITALQPDPTVPQTAPAQPPAALPATSSPAGQTTPVPGVTIEAGAQITPTTAPGAQG